MYKDKKILAVIPARGGSKGLPGKNIKLLYGKPLIAWSIGEALRSKYLDKIIVSTDDRRISRISRKYGVEVPFLRPKKLATSKAKMIDVLLHALAHFKKKRKSYDLIMLLQATSPLRGYRDIDASIELLFRKKAKSVISVCESGHHPSLLVKLTRQGQLTGFNKKMIMNKNRQELAPYYRINGALYFSYIDYLKKRKGFIGSSTYAYVMPRERSIDIDTEFDFKLAEFFLSNIIKRKKCLRI